MSSSGRYLQGEPAQALLVYSGVLRVLSRTQPPSVPEVNWEETAALSAAGKRPGWGQASKQPTEHPTFRVFVHFRDKSHNVTRDSNGIQSHNIHNDYFFIQIGVQKYCIHHSNQRLMSWLDLIDDCL